MCLFQLNYIPKGTLNKHARASTQTNRTLEQLQITALP